MIGSPGLNALAGPEHTGVVELDAGQGAIAVDLVGDPGQEGQVVNVSGHDLRGAQQAGVLPGGVNDAVAQGDKGGAAHGLHPKELHIPLGGMTLRRGIQVKDRDGSRLNAVFQGLAPNAKGLENVGIVFFHL